MTKRIRSFADCERWALTEALEFHIEFLERMLRENATQNAEHKEYCEHMVAHCRELLDEFEADHEPDDLHKYHPAHVVRQ